MKTVTIEEAREQLESLTQLVSQGEQVFIEGKSALFEIQRAHQLPVAPPGYYDDIYDEEYIKDAKLTEPHSVISIDP